VTVTDKPINTKAVGGGIAAVALAGALALAAPIIQRWEGVRHEPYRDSVGVLTVCYGHTKTVQSGKRYTKAECDALLAADMAEANGYVRQCIGVPMLRQVEASLTSAVFNLGPQVVCGSTLQRKAGANDWPGACAELSRWDKAGGRQLKGLVLRRDDERALCEGRALWGGT